MHEATESKHVLSVLRDRPVSVDPARTEALRARAVPLLEEHVRAIVHERRRARRLRFLVRCLAAIVSGAVAVFAVHALRKPGAAVESAQIRAVEGHLVHEIGGAQRTVSPGDILALPVTGEFSTGATEATLETSEGLRLHLETASSVSLSGLSRNGRDGSVSLEQGQIQCAVPKLHGGAKFSVETPNARIVVHGTRFTVRVDSMEAGVTRTCVRVTEGVVSVEQGTSVAMLQAGDEWGCGTAVSTADGPRPAKATAPGNRLRVPARAQGTLGEETTLLQTALAEERRGHRAAASVAAARLVARYPDSPLAPEARAVLDRLSQAPFEGR